MTTSDAPKQYVFLSSNCHQFDGRDFADIADSVRSAVDRHGRVLVYYRGLNRDVASSNLDREVRSDFFGASAVLLCFSEGQASLFSVQDHWTTSELPHLNNPAFIYLEPDVSTSTEQTLRAMSDRIHIRRLARLTRLESVVDSDLREIFT